MMAIDTTNMCSHLKKKLFEEDGEYYRIWMAIQALVIEVNDKKGQEFTSDIRTYYESLNIKGLFVDRKIVTKDLSHVIDRNKWCKENNDKFKFYVPEVDGTYNVSTIFLTYHENAYNYFDHQNDFGLRFLSAMDIVENPMIVLNE